MRARAIAIDVNSSKFQLTFFLLVWLLTLYLLQYTVRCMQLISSSYSVGDVY